MFNPNDVARCLDIKDVNSSIRGFSSSQKVKLTNSDMHSMQFRKLNNAGENFLTESGVYKLIFKSRSPFAEEFQDWVTDDVLPSIRKHGAYMTTAKAEEILTSPETIIQLAQQIIDERNAKMEALKVIEAKNKEIEIMKPKSEYCDMVLKSTSAVTITTIAKDYGMSAIKMNKLLAEMKIQYKQGKTWFLYSQYQDKGYTKSHTTYFEKENGEIGTSVNTQWTQKGRLFLYEQLKAKDILPVCEMDSEIEHEV